MKNVLSTKSIFRHASYRSLTNILINNTIVYNSLKAIYWMLLIIIVFNYIEGFHMQKNNEHLESN